MKYRLTGRSHNPADPFIPRFDLQIPNGDSIEADLTPEQLLWLQNDIQVRVEMLPADAPAPEPEPETPPVTKRSSDRGRRAEG